MIRSFFETVGMWYFLIAAILIAVAAWLPRKRHIGILGGAAVAVVAMLPLFVPAPTVQQSAPSPEPPKEIVMAKRRFAELCKSAGVKIYRSVDDVDAVLLAKVRPVLSAKELADPMLPGAGLAGERQGDEYIATFLGVESRPSGNPPEWRGTVSLAPGIQLPRYHNVEAIDPADGQRYAYTASMREVEYFDTSRSQKMKTLKPALERTRASGPAPSYVVDFEDLVDPEDRKMWIAGSKIRVLDRTSGEILGEFTTYVMDIGMGATGRGTRDPWSHAASREYRCPVVKGSVDTVTRYFVDQVLKPKRGG